MGAAGLKLLDHGEQVADRAGEAVEPDHDQGFTGTDLAEEPRQNGARSISPGRVLFKHSFAASGAEFVELGIGALLLGRDTGVADQTAGEGGFPRFC